MAKAKFASYEKVVEATIVNIRHTVRIRLDENVTDIIHILKMVPPGAKVIGIIDNTAIEGNYAIIHFVEKQGEELRSG